MMILDVTIWQHCFAPVKRIISTNFKRELLRICVAESNKKIRVILFNLQLLAAVKFWQYHFSILAIRECIYKKVIMGQPIFDKNNGWVVISLFRAVYAFEDPTENSRRNSS